MNPDGTANGGGPASGQDSAASPDAVPPVQIPDHKLLRRIGRGSYGEVWLARNIMGVYRAAKVVYRKSTEDQRAFERELSGIRQFEPISRSYEGFVDILHVGINEADGYFYYLMELGDDRLAGQAVDPDRYAPNTLAHEISRCGRLPGEDCLKLGLALSMSLAELHKHGLVHRDVKPSNIIFVNGVPKLADIGLVTGIREAPSYVGTEGFIPPEGPGTPQADVFGLGKVLYEAGTGQDRLQFPELPTKLDRFSDDKKFLELNEVILQACTGEARKRYQTAWEMHAHLVAIANGKSVKRLRLLERRLGRIKRSVLVGSLVLLALLPLLYQLYREKRTALAARAQEFGKNLAFGAGAMNSGDYMGAFPYFAEGFRLDSRKAEAEREQRLRFGSGLAAIPKLVDARFFGRQISDVALSPDGQRLLVARAYGHAEAYNLATAGASPQLFAPWGWQKKVVISLDGQLVATAIENTNVAYVWDAASLQLVSRLDHTNYVCCAQFSPDGGRIVTGCRNGFVQIWDARSGKQILSFLGHTDFVVFAAFSPEGRRVVTASDDMTARIWNATNGAQLAILPHTKRVHSAVFSLDGQLVVTTSDDKKATVWDVSNGARRLLDLDHHDAVRYAEFSPDGRLLVTACLDGTVQLWRVSNLKHLETNPILRIGGPCERAGFAADGRRVFAACKDGSFRLWDLAGAVTIPALVGCALSDDGLRLLVKTNNSYLIRDACSGQLVSPPISTEAPLEAASLSHNGRFALVVKTNEPPASERILRICDAANARTLGPAVPLGQAAHFALSDDGARLAIYTRRKLQVLATTTAKVQFSNSFKDFVTGALFSSDGASLAISSTNNLHMLNAANGQEKYVLRHEAWWVKDFAFSPDGKYFATCCGDNQTSLGYARVWKADNGEPVAPPLRHSDGVFCVSFSPDSRQVVTGGRDSAVMVWDTLTGRRLGQPITPRSRSKIKSAAFSPDGAWIVTVTEDQEVQIWNPLTGEPLSPPLQNGAPVERARFLRNGLGIGFADDAGHASIWKLPLEKKPASDFVDLARLLSGNLVDLPGVLNWPTGVPLESLWQRLKSRYPEDFSVSPEQIVAWHEKEARDSEIEHNWKALIFHLHQLQALHPGDPTLSEHLKRAASMLPGTAPQ
jgi:WD40 repeat protein